MAGNGSKITVTGLREFQHGMRGMGDEQKRALPAALKDVAHLVAAKIASKFPRRKGKAAGSIKARSSQKGAGIAFGGPKAPHTPWLDFGGTVGKGHHKGVPHSGSVERTYLGRPYGDGRYVYPTIVDEGPEIQKAVAEAFERVAKSHGFEVKG